MARVRTSSAPSAAPIRKSGTEALAAPLKVFEWSDGVHTYTVAVSSRAKALAAWGVRQDLFASGTAREHAESPDAEAARAHPGQIVKRRNKGN